MSSDFKIMKTAVFGGFKKSDVLSYVENLQAETVAVQNQLEEKRNEALDLKRRIDELELKVKAFGEISEKLSQKEKEAQELSVKLELALAENKRHSERLAEYDEKSEKLRRAEKQIGAAYIDARRYTDELVDNAKAKAKDIGAIASQDVKREANEIEQLLKDVDAISRKFNSSLEQLHKDVYALGTKLNSSASALLSIHTDVNEIEPRSLSDIPEDAVKVEKTDDGTELTIISYPPNTEFNEDLNLSSDSVFGFDKKEG